MWRDVDEDWERRKSYLIRSLFHDIPVLSPVPESDESRQTSRSSLPEPTRSVSPSRPESPLPPLIIEKMPNRHDDPPEFYRQLEKKIMKIYRKVFFDEEVGSEEDLPETYSDDIDFCLNAEETENKGNRPESTDSCLPSEHNRSCYIIPRNEKSTSNCTSQHESTNKSSSSHDSNKNASALLEGDDDTGVSEARSDGTSPSSVNGETQITDDCDKNNSDLPDKENPTAASEVQSNGTSSTSVNGETHITVDVMVHEADNFEDVPESRQDLNECRSPILQLTSRSVLIHDHEREPHQDSEAVDVMVHEADNFEDVPESPNDLNECRSPISQLTSRSVLSHDHEREPHQNSEAVDVMVHEADNFEDVLENPEDLDECRSPISQLTSRSVLSHDPVREPHQYSEAVDVMVDEADNFEDVPESPEDLDECRSPILQLSLRSVLIRSEEREYHQDSEELSSQNNADSELGDEEVSRVESHNSRDTNVSTRSVELMRRQEIISPSWSLQDDHDETETSRHSDIIGFKRKTSFEIHVGEASWIQNAAEDLTLSGEMAHDFLNVSTVLSPIPLSHFNRSSVKTKNLPAAARRDCETPAVKRKKYEDLAVQTSTVEDNENMDWDDLKSNFFVGTPAIFKLCSCNDHKCETRQ